MLFVQYLPECKRIESFEFSSPSFVRKAYFKTKEMKSTEYFQEWVEFGTALTIVKYYWTAR